MVQRSVTGLCQGTAGPFLVVMGLFGNLQGILYVMRYGSRNPPDQD